MASPLFLRHAKHQQLHSPAALSWPRRPFFSFPAFISLSSLFIRNNGVSAFSASNLSNQNEDKEQEAVDAIPDTSAYPKSGSLKSGLYLVATPIGNLEDITLRALRVLRTADVILSEDTRHSGKLLQHYNIKTPLMSYHKFNEAQREKAILKRLHQGDVVALISDAGTPGIGDPGTELAKLCVNEDIPVIPIPGPSAFVAALSASGLSTEEFAFVGFLPKHAGSRKERILISSNETTTQIFFVPPHKLHQFLEETSLFFGDSRRCVIARELTKIHEKALSCVIVATRTEVIINIDSGMGFGHRLEERRGPTVGGGKSFDLSTDQIVRKFWRGTLGKAKEAFSSQHPKGEITLLIEGKEMSIADSPSEAELEEELRDLILNGHSLSMAVKLVAEGKSVKRKSIYALALRKFGKTDGKDDSS